MYILVTMYLPDYYAQFCDLEKSISEEITHRKYRDSLLKRIKKCKGCKFVANIGYCMCQSDTYDFNLECEAGNPENSHHTNRMGVFGELAFWHRFVSHGIELTPSGLKDGYPDFLIESQKVYLEVVKPIVFDIQGYFKSREDVNGSIDAIDAVLQRSIAGALDRKLLQHDDRIPQFKRWNDSLLKDNNAYACLCLDMTGFMLSDLLKGEFDPIAKILYGVGNVVYDISRNTGRVCRVGFQTKKQIEKGNGVSIEVAYFERVDYDRLVGVLALLNNGELRFYFNYKYRHVGFQELLNSIGASEYNVPGLLF